MKRNFIIRIARCPLALAAMSLALGASIAQAHPGHGVFENGLRHAFTSPDHLLVLGLAGAALAGSAFLVQKSRWRLRRSLRVFGVLMIVTAFTVWRLSA